MNKMRKKGPQPPSMDIIRANDYSKEKTQEMHIFLAGNLRRPIGTPFLRDSRIEWIICRYDAGDDGLPHWHTVVTEYEMVTSGRIGYLEISSGETRWFDPGDFLRIPAGACVKRIVPAPSSSVTVKTPSDDDKIHCDNCKRECSFRLAACLAPHK